MSARSSNGRKSSSSRRKTTPLGLEQLEQRMMFAVDSIQTGLALLGAPVMGGGFTQQTVGAANAAPSVASTVSSGQTSQVKTRSTVLSILGQDDGGESNLTYSWRVAAGPTGGSATFSVNGRNAAKQTTATFSRAGVYSVVATITDRAGLTVTDTIQLNVEQTLTSFQVKTVDNRVLSATTSLGVSGTSQQLVVIGLDQFGQAMTTQPTFSWSTVTAPSNSAPTFAQSDANTTVSFSSAGSYALRVQSGSVSFVANLNVMQTLTSAKAQIDNVLNNPGASTSVNKDSQKVTFIGYDQFGKLMSSASSWNWTGSSTTAGATAKFSTTNGLTTITFNKAGNYTLVAKSGAVTFSFTTAVSQTFSRIGLYTPDKKTGLGMTDLSVNGTSRKLIAVAQDQFGLPMASQPSFDWTSVSAPSGGTASISTDSEGATVTFNKAGAYRVKATSGSLSSTLSIAVGQVLTQIGLVQSSNSNDIAANSSLSINGTSVGVKFKGYDQFGNVMADLPNVRWSATSTNREARTSFGTTNDLTTISVNRAATYTIKATSGIVSKTFTLSVSAVFTRIAIYTPELKTGDGLSSTVVTGTSRRLVVVAQDQFGVAMATQPTITWSSTASPNNNTPTISSTADGVNIAFGAIGSYSFSVSADAITRNFSASVVSTLTSIGMKDASGNAITAGSTLSGTAITSKYTVVGYDQFNNVLNTKIPVIWSATSTNREARGTLTYNVNNSELTAVVNRAATYALRGQVGSISTTFNLSIGQVFTSVRAIGTDSKAIESNTPVAFSGTALRLNGRALDQFGVAMATQPTISWTNTEAPSGGSVSIAVADTAATLAFTKAGTYRFQIASGGATQAFTVNVAQALKTISVTPGGTSVFAGQNKQFSASALDQFGNAMTSQPTFAWSTKGGSINSSGYYTAPSTLGSYAVSAVAGGVTGSTQITVGAAPESTDFQNTALKNLVTTLFADGSISRTEMIQILRSAGSDGVVDGVEFSDLKYFVSNASKFNFASYVQVLANNVVSGNAANRLFKGVTAGNLVAGSSGTLLNNLVDKWFLGADVPTLTSGSLSYQYAAGVLFNGNPSRADERQGMLGDCYFIASVGAIADRNPDAIKNMFIDNGDGTFTVRFYGGTYGYQYQANGTVTDGFTNGVGVADYVTVDRRLPATLSGTLAYSGYGSSVSSSSTTLWIALAEKAYAQWNETGKEGRNGTNSYAAIEGGWMANVNAQVLGKNSSSYSTSSAASKQALIDALNAGRAVTIGTKSTASNGLYGSHAYSVTGYNAGNDTFNLYNPWGTSHPGQLTWAQLQTNCSAFVVADPTGSSPIVVSGGVRAGLVDAFGSWSTSDVIVAGGLYAEATVDNEAAFEALLAEPIDNQYDSDFGDASNSNGFTILATDSEADEVAQDSTCLNVDLIFGSNDLNDLFSGINV